MLLPTTPILKYLRFKTAMTTNVGEFLNAHFGEFKAANHTDMRVKMIY